MTAVRHLAGADTIAADVGLTRAKFDHIVRLASAMPLSLDTDAFATTREIARDTGATPEQVEYVVRAWVLASERHPPGRS